MWNLWVSQTLSNVRFTLAAGLHGPLWNTFKIICVSPTVQICSLAVLSHCLPFSPELWRVPHELPSQWNPEQCFVTYHTQRCRRQVFVTQKFIPSYKHVHFPLPPVWSHCTRLQAGKQIAAKFHLNDKPVGSSEMSVCSSLWFDWTQNL